MAISHRPLSGTRRTHRVRLYFNDAEYAALAGAAERVKLGVSAFAAEVVAGVARGEIPLGATPRDVLEALIKATVPVVRAGAALERAMVGEAAGGAVERLEAVLFACRRTLGDLDAAARVARKAIITAGRRPPTVPGTFEGASNRTGR